MRRSERLVERELERMDAGLRLAGTDAWIPVKVRDLSLAGFGLQAAPGPGARLLPAADSPADFRLSGPWEGYLTVPCLIRNVQSFGDGIRVGLERRVSPDGRHQHDGSGLELSGDERILVRIANPILYNEYADCVLTGFLTSGEWLFETEDDSLLLIPGVPARVLFDLPVGSKGESRGVITHVRAAVDGKARFAIAWAGQSFQLAHVVGECLLRTTGRKPKDLLPFGIQPRRFKEDLRFTFISTLEEYSQVLDLRREAYVSAGRRPPEETPAQLASHCDAHSRILAAYHGEVMVACVSLAFGQDEGKPLRSEGEFPGGKYPVPMPARSRMMEIHSLCTRMEYRGGDLMRGFIEHMARCLILSDREWAVTIATEEMWTLYRKLGFRKVGVSAHIRASKGAEHHLILLHRSAPERGKGMGLGAWGYFYGSLSEDLAGKGFLHLGAWESLLSGARNRLLGWVCSRAGRLVEKEFQAFLEGLSANRGTGKP